MGFRTVSENPFQSNVLFYGDNIDILDVRRNLIPSESIDLIYLDPPFNSKADYNILFKEASGEQSSAQIQAFTDFWHWDAAAKKTYDYLISNEVDERIASVAEAMYRFLGRNDMSAYLFMMAIRLIELHRVLKPTGSLYLHCDPTASHYLKQILDSIFGHKNFRNEIIWKRTFAHSGAKRCGPVHDVILFYTKTDEYTWHPKPIEYSKSYVDNFFKFNDNKKGAYRLTLLTGSGTRNGLSGKPWRGINPTKIGRHWAIPGYMRPMLEGDHGKLDVQAALDKLDDIGRVFWPKKKAGVPMFMQYKDDLKGVDLQDVWTDIPPIPPHSPERLGYPTQKPVDLLRRIIDASSNEGDWVLDPFCGCGTAVIASEQEQRHWIGIDITYLAINLIKNRMGDSFPYAKFRVEGEPSDMGGAQELAKNRYQFQWWALSLIGARPVGSKSDNPREGKKGADQGIDGWLRFKDGENQIERIVVQVKSGHVGVKDIRELDQVVARQNAAMGVFITLEEATGEMLKELHGMSPYISPTWQRDYPRLQILTVKELLDGKKKPDIPATLNPFLEAPIEKKTSTTISGNSKLF